MVLNMVARPLKCVNFVCKSMKSLSKKGLVVVALGFVFVRIVIPFVPALLQGLKASQIRIYLAKLAFALRKLTRMRASVPADIIHKLSRRLYYTEILEIPRTGFPARMRPNW